MRVFDLIVDISKRNKFDIFGWFESSPELSLRDQDTVAKKIVSEFAAKNSDKFSSVKMTNYSYNKGNGEMSVRVEVI